MKYYLIDGTFCENRPQGPAFKEALDAHHAYWAPFIQKGDVLISGPKMSGAGLIILKAENDEVVQKMIANDPFVLGGVATFTASEFKAFFKVPAIEAWFSE